MSRFYKLLGIALLVATTNNFVWFALTYWGYLETKSVVTTSTIAAIWLISAAVSGIWFVSIVDHHKKKNAILGSSVATLVFFILGFAVLNFFPPDIFKTISSFPLWIFVLILLFGTTAGSIYAIAIPTLVAVMVPEDKRDRANGMFGTVMGVSFAITSVASGLVLGYGGMHTVLISAIAATAIAIFLLWLLPVPGEKDHSYRI